jgi:hypothetical protein
VRRRELASWLGRRPVVAERARLAVEILTTYCHVRWWLARVGFPEVVAAARAVGADVVLVERAEADLTAVSIRLGAIVQTALRRIPFDTRCLVRSLVLTRLLARRGIQATFVLGVRANPEFAAHAWLERDGVALLPTTSEFERLTQV